MTNLHLKPQKVEAYYEIMFDESSKTAAVLGHNYPNSKK